MQLFFLIHMHLLCIFIKENLLKASTKTFNFKLQVFRAFSPTVSVSHLVKTYPTNFTCICGDNMEAVRRCQLWDPVKSVRLTRLHAAVGGRGGGCRQLHKPTADRTLPHMGHVKPWGKPDDGMCVQRSVFGSCINVDCLLLNNAFL